MEEVNIKLYKYKTIHFYLNIIILVLITILITIIYLSFNKL